ncbi:MAG: ABC-F family ATP-binding cassette domain-containing protein [Spirochaetes bacterium]|nr:ABC-F family ATP-binding cassette domain-containing protein [Spirochaetota bacterium]
MISIENISKSYGERVLLDNVNFRINQKERVGLVGRNGHGKTTLFRIITGEEHADSGSVIIPKHYKLGYVKQQLDFTGDSVLNECMLGLNEHEKDHYWKAEKVLAGLGFSGDDMQRHPSEFSGGYQVRLNLAKVLVSDCNLLLLDEPTNYLDILSIRWIERFLVTWPGELMLISHDRSFMDRLVTHTVGIHRKKARKIAGDTEKYYSHIAREEEIYEKTRVNDEKKRKEVEQFINRFRAKARLANMVQSRIKALEKKEKKQKLENIEDLDFYFNFSSFNAKQVMSVSDLSFGYSNDNILIDHFSITIGAKDRICIVGKNGKGKTTLLKLLAGTLKPSAGEMHLHPNTETGFYEQTNIQSLEDRRTVEQEILSSNSQMERQQARNICGAMMFEGDDALKKIAVLSGGEKSRVMLGKILAKPVNLLLLDEPTNHLDMVSCDALLEAIDSFDGAVIIVTHNEMFLHALAERLIVFQNGVSVFEGGYQTFLEKRGWQEEDEPEQRQKNISNKNFDGNKLNKKEVKRRRSEIIQERSRVLKPIEERISQIENLIEERETELEKFNESMVQASHEQDGKLINELSCSIFNCKSAIDTLFSELEEITVQQEEKSRVFQEKLDVLENESMTDVWN